MTNIEDARPFIPKDAPKESINIPSAAEIISGFAEAIASERIGGIYIPNPKRFAQGFIDGFKSTGLGLGAIAYNILEHPEVAKDIFAADLQAAVENPREFFGEHGDLIAEGVEAWWEHTEANDFEDFSYDTGSMVGMLAPRILTHGAASMENLGEIAPGLGRPERVIFLGGLLREELLGEIENKVPGSTKFINRLWEEFERRIEFCVDPRKMDEYADAIKNMFLFEREPEKHPIKPDTLRFIRNELVEGLYTLVNNQTMNPEAVILFIGAFSILIHANKDKVKLAAMTIKNLTLEDVDEGMQSANVYLDGTPVSETEKNAFVISREAIRKALEAKQLPPKEVLIQLTEVLIKRLI